MRRSHTAVIERSATFDGSFATEPYECAWAGEARWFVRVQEVEGANALLRASVQVSPDGLFWCDEGTAFPDIREPGLYSLPVREFGGWLRLDCAISDADPAVKLMITLALKE